MYVGDGLHQVVRLVDDDDVAFEFDAAGTARRAVQQRLVRQRDELRGGDGEPRPVVRTRLGAATQTNQLLDVFYVHLKSR